MYPGTSWQRISQAYTVDSTSAMRIHLFENPGPETSYWDEVTIRIEAIVNGLAFKKNNSNMMTQSLKSHEARSGRCFFIADRRGARLGPPRFSAATGACIHT